MGTVACAAETQEMQAMMPLPAKPAPGARGPGPDHPTPEAAPAVSPVRRRADLEAQKRYMDDDSAATGR